MDSMEKRPAALYAIVGAAMLLAAAIFLLSPGRYDDFARCTKESGAKMYGSVDCPHCKEQKELFGGSWQYAGYVECSLPGGYGQAPECDAAGIKAYPTWVFKDGTKRLGMMSFEELSGKTGCPLPS